MRKVRDTTPLLKHICRMTAAVAALTIALGSMAAADEPTYVDADQPGGTVKLYNSPGAKESAMDAPTLPLRITGPSQHQFYPVTVNNRPYWVSGMDVKVIRNAQVKCSESAGVQSAATLGAATNRCK